MGPTGWNRPGSRRSFLSGWDGSRKHRGFSWRGLARKLCIDIRLVKRWRNGARPDSANLIALFSLAAEMRLLHLLLPAVENHQAGT